MTEPSAKNAPTAEPYEYHASGQVFLDPSSEAGWHYGYPREIAPAAPEFLPCTYDWSGLIVEESFSSAASGHTMNFLEALQAQGAGYDAIALQCKVTVTPIFADLCWGRELDFSALTRDPGIEFERGSRRLVLMRVGLEIRFYAGPSGVNGEGSESRIGVFPSIDAALSFAYDFLVRGQAT
jgi:hypothetical protein